MTVKKRERKVRGGPPRVLIIEDEPELLTFVANYLKEHGFEVLSAMDGMEGLRLARESQPSLILLDVNLPKLSGLTICRLLKFDEQYKEIPIIMWTWREADRDREMGLYAGADMYLPKPFTIVRLLESIEALLGLAPTQSSIGTPAKISHTSPSQ